MRGEDDTEAICEDKDGMNMDKNKLDQADIVRIEETVIKIRKILEEGVEVRDDVHRDYLGTLHVNLWALSRAARKMANGLAEKYGFLLTPVKPADPELLFGIGEARNEHTLLSSVMNTIHSIAGAYFARRALFGTSKEPPRKLTGPLKKSMQEKAFTDEQIEMLAMDVWEAVAIRLQELQPGNKDAEGATKEHPHLIGGYFQSDKYPTTPRGCVPLKCSDPVAQPLLWIYAQLHRVKDAQFSDDLELALKNQGYSANDAVDLRAIFLTVINSMDGRYKVEKGIVRVQLSDGTKWDFTMPEQVK